MKKDKKALKQRIKELEQIVENQSAILEGRAEDARLVSLVDGELTVQSPIVPAMAEAMAQMLKPHGAKTAANYTETEVYHRELGHLTMTIQRQMMPTPHQFRQKAEAQLERLKTALMPMRLEISQRAQKANGEEHENLLWVSRFLQEDQPADS